MEFYLFTWLEKSYMHLEGAKNFLEESNFEIEEIEHTKNRLKAKFKEWENFSDVVFIQDAEGLAYIKSEISKEEIEKAKKSFFELLDRIIQGYLPVRHNIMISGEFPYVINHMFLTKNKKEAEELRESYKLPNFHEEKGLTVYQKKPEIYFTSKITSEVEKDAEIFNTVVYLEDTEVEDLLDNLVFYNLWELMLKEHMNKAVSKRKKVKKISKRMKEGVSLEKLERGNETISDLIKEIAEVNKKALQAWQCFKRKKQSVERDFMKELYAVAEADGEYYDAHMERIMAYLNHVERVITIRNTFRQSVESRKLEGIMGIEAASIIASLVASIVVTTGIGLESSWLNLLLTLVIWGIIYLVARGIVRLQR